MTYLRLFFYAMLVSLVSCSGEKNDLDRAGLKGKVKYFKERQYDVTYRNDGWVAGEPLTNGFRVIHYNPEGLLVKSYSIHDRGDTLGMSTCRREDGEIVEELFYARLHLNSKNPEMSQTSKTILSRVADDQVNFEYWDGGQLKNEGANFFDSKGRIVRRVQVQNGKEAVFHHVYDKGLLVEYYRETPEGVRTGTQLYKYTAFDEEGNWTARLVYNGDEMIKPVLVVKREFSYY